MTHLESNLYSLAFLATHIKLSVYTLQEIIDNKELLDNIEFPDKYLQTIKFPNSLRAITSNFSIIQFCSFLDEYKNFNQSYIGIEYSERIKKVRAKNKYGIQRINKWKNLYDFRNQIAAHNFDIKKESILRKKEIIEYNIPDTLDEKLVFYKIIEKICNNIFSEFDEVRDNFDFTFKLNSKIEITKNSNFDLKNELKLIDENM